MQSETLAQEFSRLVKEYHEGDDHTKPEAWNLLADYAVDNASAISAALSDQERAVEVKGHALLRRMSLALDELSPDETIGFSNGVQWVEAATAEEIRAAALSRNRVAEIGIKPLEWFESHVPAWNGDYHTVPTAYTVRCADANGWKWSGFGGFGYSSSPIGAKAAAQADYEHRIRGALVDVPVEPVGYLFELFYPGSDRWSGQMFSDHDPVANLPAEHVRNVLPLYTRPPHREGEDSAEVERKFKLGDRVSKTKGSSWNGLVVGFYSTAMTPVGYAVESEREPGSVQIYPESALAATRSGSATTAERPRR